MPHDTPISYTLCANAEAATAAIRILSQAPHVIIDCEGQSIGRGNGVLSLMCIGTPGAKTIFLFDTLALSRDEPSMLPLIELLESNEKMKIMWDGRQDFLEIFERYGIKLGGVLDLQLAEVVSRGAARGENHRRRVQRLRSSYRPLDRANISDAQLDGIHIVVGLQRCLQENGLAGRVAKDRMSVRS